MVREGVEGLETEAKLVEDYVLQRWSEIIENDKEEPNIFFEQDSSLLKDIMLALGNKSLAKKFEKRFCKAFCLTFRFKWSNCVLW